MNIEHTTLGRVVVIAERSVAWTSPDHIMPWGTRRDSSRNRRFNEKLYALYANARMLSILDIGCSGGGFVKDCLDDGHLAIGLEGSDFSKIHRRAEWGMIPDSLFTCDITGNWDIYIESSMSSRRLEFDVITSWEVMEHIAETELDKVIMSVKKHLAPGALWITSIATYEEIVNGIRIHQTVRPKDWWIAKFKQLGLEHLEEYVRYFNTQFIRGPKYNATMSFHLVLSQDRKQVPPIPHEKLSTRIYDWWLGSRPQKILRRWLLGV